MKKAIIIAFVATWFSSVLHAQHTGENRVFSHLRKSNFYLLDALTHEDEVAEIIAKNPLFTTIAQNKQEKIQASFQEPLSLEKLIGAYLFSENDIRQSADELVGLLKKEGALRDFFGELRASGKYQNFHHFTDEEFARRAWELCLTGLNYTLTVYGLGEAPRYDKIDAVSYDVHSEFFVNSAFSWATTLRAPAKKEPLFFEHALEFASSLLYMNHRDEAVRYEPLHQHNLQAIDKAKKADLRRYPYSSIIVLGNGPENYTDRLSALGKLNLYLGVREYLAGKAPFIIVSGGHVHPNRTPFCEAIEMRKELMEVYLVPEESIIIEPYARHTTTNLRNAARLMLQYGIDVTKNSLVVTNYGHSKYTSSALFEKRCREELGYLPGTIRALSEGGLLEFLPNALVTHQNPLEPLDP